MKINEINRLGALNQYQKKPYAGGADKSGKSDRKDEVLISSQAKALHGSQSAEASRQSDRIQPLKNSVNAGTYHIDAYELADRLLPYFTSESGE